MTTASSIAPNTFEIPRGRIDDSLWIDNSRHRASGDRYVDVDDSASEQVIATVKSATREDVDRAFAAARRAQREWSATVGTERVRIVREAARLLEVGADRLSDVIISEVGTASREVTQVQVGLGLAAFRVTADNARHALAPIQLTSSSVLREPAGVVAAITPWNYPIFQVALKVAPALVAGCSVVLKPPGVAPLTAFAVAQAFAAAGLPDGVLNIVCGAGGEIGDYIASHSEADFVSFTGSVAAGRAVAAAAGRAGTRTALELGGKSAALVVDDHLLEQALAATFASTVSNTGQTCAALSRLVVPRRLLRRAEDLAVGLVDAAVVGDPRAANTTIGPMSSRGQRGTVLGFLRDAADDAGVRVSAVGSLDGLERGWFAPPAVLVAEDHRARVVQRRSSGLCSRFSPMTTWRKPCSWQTQHPSAYSPACGPMMRTRSIASLVSFGSAVSFNRVDRPRGTPRSAE